jgi:hypothetical protein
LQILTFTKYYQGNQTKEEGMSDNLVSRTCVEREMHTKCQRQTHLDIYALMEGNIKMEINWA